jgi:hypothetical protein
MTDAWRRCICDSDAPFPACGRGTGRVAMRLGQPRSQRRADCKSALLFWQFGLQVHEAFALGVVLRRVRQRQVGLQRGHGV